MDYRGRQIFIIHPDPVIRSTLVRNLRRIEYEAFGLSATDPELLVNRRNPVVFLSSGGSDEGDYETLIRETRRKSQSVLFVALSDDGIQKGFDAFIGSDPEGLGKRISEYLEGIEAQGHRHYIRFGGQYASIASFDFHLEDNRYAGIVHDISRRSAACTFRPEPQISTHLEVREMQLNLPGHRISLPGRFTTHRVVAGQMIHVFMFSQNLETDVLDSLYDFIYTSLEMKLSRR